MKQKNKRLLGLFLAFVMLLSISAAWAPQAALQASAGTDFAEARAAALSAIAAANLPDAEQFVDDGLLIVVPGQHIARRIRRVNQPAIPPEDLTQLYHEHMRLFTDWPELGVPALSGAWGSRPATGIYALIDALKALDPVWDIEDDPCFDNFVAFAKLHSPAARAGTVVESKMVNITGNHAATQRSQEADYSETGFESWLDYRVFLAAIEVGFGQMPEGLRVADFIPDAGPAGGPGPAWLYPWDGVRAQVFDFDFNHEGVAIGFRPIMTDLVQGFEMLDGGTRIRIGDFHNVIVPVQVGAKVFNVTAAGAANAHEGITETTFGEVSSSIANNIRVLFSEDRLSVREAYIVPGTRAIVPVNATSDGRFHYHFGVLPDDPVFGFDSEMMPHPVDFALFDPTRFPAVTGATAPDGRYPLIIHFHGVSGGAAYNSFANGTGTPLAGEGFQRLFENENPDLSGAFVMIKRSSARASSSLGLCWLHGNRSITNPLWARGDVRGRAVPTHAAPIVANIRRLIAENPNIDPNRIYLTGFSAGAFMALFTLLEDPSLFAGLKFVAPAFFPDDAARPNIDSPVFFEGSNFTEKMLAAKGVPIWLAHAVLDTITPFYATVQQPLPQTINGQNTIAGIINSFRYDPDGSPMTRVCIFNHLFNANGMTPAGQHSQVSLTNNNMFNPVDITCSQSGETERLTFYSRFYGVRPANWVSGAIPFDRDGDPFVLPAMTTAPLPAGTLYARGLSSVYSTQVGWYGTMTEWLNIAGRLKQGTTKDVKLVSAVANNIPGVGTTEIILTFDDQPSQLEPEHITITGTGNTEVDVVRVTGREGSRKRNIIVKGFWEEGDRVSVSLVNTPGVTFTVSEFSGIELKGTPPDTRERRTLTGAVADGSAGTANTTMLTLTFDDAISAAIASGNITITNTTAAGRTVTAGAVSGTGNKRAVAITGIWNDGDVVSVSVSRVRGYRMTGTQAVTLHRRVVTPVFAQPVNADGSSVARLGSTVPVKFRLRVRDGELVTNATARMFVSRIGDTGTEMKAVSTSGATEGNLFRLSGNQYIFNWSTRGLQVGTWQIRIELNDGTSHFVRVSLR